MLAVLTSHPIQYQVPLWREIAKDKRVPLEVWFLLRHGSGSYVDTEFGQDVNWGMEMLSGFPHEFLSVAPGASPHSFWRCRLVERLRDRLHRSGSKVLWIQGWQVAAYWQAVHEARAAGVEVWLRAESNDLAPEPVWKRPLKRLLLGWLFRRVDRFLYIGEANKRLYLKYGVPEARLSSAPYCVDNERFSREAEVLRPIRDEIRRRWRIPEDATCVLLCGKFIPKKRPMDLVRAVAELRRRSQGSNLHLLFVGSGELGQELRSACRVVYDVEVSSAPGSGEVVSSAGPPASFVGFLNQKEICRAYAAADCLVLPSDHGETWGLVVNEALASGLQCVVSDACGCAEDLLKGTEPARCFACGDIAALQSALDLAQRKPLSREFVLDAVARNAMRHTVRAVSELYSAGAGVPTLGEQVRSSH